MFSPCDLFIHSREEDLRTIAPNPKVKMIREMIVTIMIYLLNSPFLRIVLMRDIFKLNPKELNHLGMIENPFDES